MLSQDLNAGVQWQTKKIFLNSGVLAFSFLNLYSTSNQISNCCKANYPILVVLTNRLPETLQQYRIAASMYVTFLSNVISKM